MTPLQDGRENYYKKMLDLQERLRKSEEERIRLEERFKHLVEESRNRHELCINRLRMRYIEFLEEQRHRDERNNELMGTLDRVDSSLSLMTAKTDRLNVLRKQYEAYLLRTYANQYPGSATGDSGLGSQNDRVIPPSPSTSSRLQNVSPLLPPSSPKFSTRPLDSYRQSASALHHLDIHRDSTYPLISTPQPLRRLADPTYPECRKDSPLPGYLDYSLRYSRPIPQPNRGLSSSELDELIRRNEVILPKDYATTYPRSSLVDRDKELDQFIGQIKSLHCDLEPRHRRQSLEDADHEQNTSGDLLNVSLSDDGLDLTGEERKRMTEDVESVLALADELAKNAAVSSGTRTADILPSEKEDIYSRDSKKVAMPDSETRRDVLDKDRDEISAAPGIRIASTEITKLDHDVPRVAKDSDRVRFFDRQDSLGLRSLFDKPNEEKEGAHGFPLLIKDERTDDDIRLTRDDGDNIRPKLEPFTEDTFRFQEEDLKADSGKEPISDKLTKNILANGHKADDTEVIQEAVQAFKLLAEEHKKTFDDRVKETENHEMSDNGEKDAIYRNGKFRGYACRQATIEEFDEDEKDVDREDDRSLQEDSDHTRSDAKDVSDHNRVLLSQQSEQSADEELVSNSHRQEDLLDSKIQDEGGGSKGLLNVEEVEDSPKSVEQGGPADQVEENRTMKDISDIEDVDTSKKEAVIDESEKSKKKKDVIRSILDSDTDSTIERNISNTESDFDFN